MHQEVLEISSNSKAVSVLRTRGQLLLSLIKTRARETADCSVLSRSHALRYMYSIREARFVASLGRRSQNPRNLIYRRRRNLLYPDGYSTDSFRDSCPPAVQLSGWLTIGLPHWVK